jgi:hypothetical protein
MTKPAPAVRRTTIRRRETGDDHGATPPGHRFTPDYRLATATMVAERVTGLGEATALDPARTGAGLALGCRVRPARPPGHPPGRVQQRRASDIPQSLLRLIWAIRDAGHEVEAPRCVGCGRPARDMQMVRDGGRICNPC